MEEWKYSSGTLQQQSFSSTQYNTDAHNMYAHSSLWTYVRKTYFYEHLRRTEPAYLKILEATIDVLLLTKMSLTI